MAVREILLLGNPALYQPAEPVSQDELSDLKSVAEDLRDTLLDFRHRHGRGRAIAAPQIGVRKRLIYWDAGKPQVIVNPVLEDLSSETFELWDDCMSFPDLLVRVVRHRRCSVRFQDLEWNETVWQLKDALSELVQHEYDHLDGILATQRAIDSRSFAVRSEV
ncbi:MAG: peptide deformylase [candidate division Zixibacteria bacterium]|nr:peptide deformylase [candidate division Zixibacteria bacterium]